MAITKNRQSEETISGMTKRAFPDKKIAAIKELTEGMCNVTYDKPAFLEEMFEYHMQFNVELTIAFVNDKVKLQRLAIYGRCSEPSLQLPVVGWVTDAAYIKGNRIILLGGDYKSLNYELPTFETDLPSLYSCTDQATADYKYETYGENALERLRLAEVEQKAYWIRNKLCRHCGGEFEGWLFKKCKNCGKSKDH